MKITEITAIDMSEATAGLLESSMVERAHNSLEIESDTNLEACEHEMASCMFVNKAPEDIYAIIINPSSTNVYVTVLSIFLFQMLVLSLMITDFFDYPEGSPPLNAAKGISDTVRVSQFLAIVISIIIQEDITTSLNMITNLAVLKIDSVSPKLYVASCICRVTVGLFGLMISFIITIQSTNTIELFSDFAAMAFISSIDNVVFTLACKGYFSEKVQEQANVIKKLSMRSLSKPAYWIRRTVLLLLFIVMASAWVIITLKQRREEISYAAQSM